MGPEPMYMGPDPVYMGDIRLKHDLYSGPVEVLAVDEEAVFNMLGLVFALGGNVGSSRWSHFDWMSRHLGI